MTKPIVPEDLALKSPIVSLLPITPADYPVFQQILNDRRVMEHLGFLSPPGGYTIEMIERRCQVQILAQKNQYGISFAVHDKNGSVVGTCGINQFSFLTKSGSVGIILAPSAWGTAIPGDAIRLTLEYAFETLGLNRVEFETSETNAKVRAFCKKAGIVLEARKREAYPVGDAFGDSLTYAVLAREWPRLKEYLQKKVDRHLKIVEAHELKTAFRAAQAGKAVPAPDRPTPPHSGPNPAL